MSPPDIKSNKHGVYVPHIRQAYDYSCGAACLASVLHYWGVWDGREPELYPLCGTTCEGTSGKGIIEVAKSFDLDVSSRSSLDEEDLRGLLVEGYTVILSIQAWGNYDDDTNMNEIWDDGHYVVLVDIDDQFVYLMDPAVAGSYYRMPISELMDCWHDYSDTGEHDWHAGIIIRGQEPALALRPVGIATYSDLNL